jgi:hypothetical protein
MPINIYPEDCEFTINAKKNYDIIFFAQCCNESLVNDNDKWQYNGTTLCPSSIFRLEGSHCCHYFVANTIWINVSSIFVPSLQSRDKDSFLLPPALKAGFTRYC